MERRVFLEYVMDHMSDWMLPGGALALVLIVGFVMVSLDAVVLAFVHPSRRTGAEPFASSDSGQAAQKPSR